MRKPLEEQQYNDKSMADMLSACDNSAGLSLSKIKLDEK